MLRLPRVSALPALAIGLLVSCTGHEAVEMHPPPQATPNGAGTDSGIRGGEVDAELHVQMPRNGADVVSSSMSLGTLDLSDAVGAPTLAKSPIGRAVAAAQLGLFSDDVDRDAIAPGQVYILVSDGSWRRVDVADYGFTGGFSAEMESALSPDGKTLALADDTGYAIVVVDLASNTFRRHHTEVPVVMHLQWSPDSHAVVFADRHHPAASYRIDLSTGKVSRTRYDATRSAFAADPRLVYELSTLAENASGAALVPYWQGYADAPRPLSDRGIPAVSAGASPVARKYVAFVNRPNAHAAAPTRSGVAVVDPQSGSMLTFVPLTRKQQTWLNLGGWLDDHTLLIVDGVGGSLWLFDVAAREFKLLARLATPGVVLSFATSVLSRAATRH